MDKSLLIDLEENGIVFTAGTGTVPSVTLSGTATCAAGATSTLTATTVPDGATVTWSSDDEDIATVSSGPVTGVAASKCNITATITVDGLDYAASKEFTVTAAGGTKSAK